MNDFITNGSEIKQRIISELKSAQQSIYIAMAWFTDRDIANCIVEAKNRNLDIDIILSSNLQNETVKLMLRGAGISVHAFETGDPRGLMHHKFCLIDGKISINGSYNYSYNASTNNVENIQVTDEPSTYSQLFSEFERLKYNIDHDIAVGETIKNQEVSITTVTNINPSLIEAFTIQLNNLVYHAAQVDTEKYIELGYTVSKENHGNIDIFRSEYQTIKERINSYSTDDSLGSKKNVLHANVSNAYEDIKDAIQSKKENEIKTYETTKELENQQIKSKINTYVEEKTKIYTGDLSTGTIGILQIKKDIELNNLEKRKIEESFLVRKFWTLDTIFVILGLFVFSFYLSIFFASAIYKVFFEYNIINKAIQNGFDPGLPQIVDANAIFKIYKDQGTLFGLIATLFFVIPLLLSNLKILGNKKKWVNTLMFFIGLLIFDIVVAIMVTKNIEEIKSLVLGQTFNFNVWDIYKHMEFWSIFIFGMLPLLICHYIIEHITSKYKTSQRDLVNIEKYNKLKNIEIESITLQSDLNLLTQKVEAIDVNIVELKNILSQNELIEKNWLNDLNEKYQDLNQKAKLIYEDFVARIKSGKIFTEMITHSVTSAYKAGFISFLPEYYAEEEVASRAKEIEKTSINFT